MEEIKVGELVRTFKGMIGKLTEITTGRKDDNGTYINIYILDNKKWTVRKNIVKHSFNIIDLIEEGDYVNGERVIEVDSFKDWIDIGDEVLRENDVKSIVTKEQFDSIEYVLEE